VAFIGLYYIKFILETDHGSKALAVCYCVPDDTGRHNAIDLVPMNSNSSWKRLTVGESHAVFCCL
jgi:hypothetical protein